MAATLGGSALIAVAARWSLPSEGPTDAGEAAAIVVALSSLAVAARFRSGRIAGLALATGLLVAPVLAAGDGSTAWRFGCDAWLAVDLAVACIALDWAALAAGSATSILVSLALGARSHGRATADLAVLATFALVAAIATAVVAYLEGRFRAIDRAASDARSIATIVQRAANPLAVLESPRPPAPPSRPKVVYVNDAFTRLTGHTSATADAAFARLRITSDDGRLVDANDLLRPAHGHVAGSDIDGNEIAYEFSAYAIESGPNVRRRVVLLATPDDAAAEERASRAERRAAELWRSANFDALTGIPNRRQLEDRLAAFVAEERAGAVLFIDCDRLKNVNDVFGHGIGDRLLVAFAERIGSLLDRKHCFARLGGDEFVAIVEDADAASASALSRTIAGALATPFAIDGRDIRLTASIGTTIRSEGDSSDDLLRDAEAAMRRAKTLGRGRTVDFSRPLRERSSRRARLEHDLEAELAGAARRIVVYYQPIVACATRGIASFEALVRWNHPEFGLLGPLEFVPIAEETGAIVALGDRVLETASRFLRELERAGLVEPSVTMSVNVSPRQLAGDGYLTGFLDSLRRAHLEPGRLCLEITESVIVDEMNATAPVFAALRSQGARVALDDFGTGYSSLRYLDQLPVDVLKIDRSFVSAPGVDGLANATIVRAIVGIAREAGLAVVAEGVETATQARAVAALGIERAQGYLFSRPIAANEIEHYLRAEAAKIAF